MAAHRIVLITGTSSGGSAVLGMTSGWIGGANA